MHLKSYDRDKRHDFKIHTIKELVARKNNLKNGQFHPDTP